MRDEWGQWEIPIQDPSRFSLIKHDKDALQREREGVLLDQCNYIYICSSRINATTFIYAHRIHRNVTVMSLLCVTSHLILLCFSYLNTAHGSLLILF